MTRHTEEITRMLHQVREGNSAASGELMEVVYEDLRGIARHYFAGERPDHTLQPTALVHEAYLRLFSGAAVDWQDRTHFFAVAAQQMRRILVDHGRVHRAQKRGSGLKVAFDEKKHGLHSADWDVEILNDLIERLARTDKDAASVVEMKFFSGMTDQEVADALGCAHSTARRHWEFARAWMERQMGRESGRKFRPIQHARHSGVGETRDK